MRTYPDEGAGGATCVLATLRCATRSSGGRHAMSRFLAGFRWFLGGSRVAGTDRHCLDCEVLWRRRREKTGTDGVGVPALSTGDGERERTRVGHRAGAECATYVLVDDRLGRGSNGAFRGGSPQRVHMGHGERAGSSVDPHGAIGRSPLPTTAHGRPTALLCWCFTCLLPRADRRRRRAHVLVLGGGVVHVRTHSSWRGGGRNQGPAARGRERVRRESDDAWWRALARCHGCPRRRARASGAHAHASGCIWRICD
ncbi:hypothetical protein L226DRAFT_121969 [Lentinus tigrinus ALCF2SS1-7]|uniref:Uncharacterized protein n=1 Tax=Lentinus tigrinus ALCF2SS1-6 TaxID=1328759 RepID=A0A5C2SSR1_9APHY|nr:hypothetical protein L227DRAFT_7704 [Lentinus tigrinus ALCF2SS1-6]RPD80836.1 hypothetical protein L226DRAFT_121969 [Lentinus tigrinus ALCF2SS1-7]